MARSLLYAVLILSVSFLVLSACLTPLLPIDDAYITFRYARNWAAGEGLVFNPGERVEAYSNFLWTALVGILAWFGISPPVGARLLGWLSLVGCAVTLKSLARRAFPDSPGGLDWGLGVFLILLPASVFHALSGMETMLAALFVLILAWATLGNGSPRVRSLLMALALTGLSLTRPEGLLLCLLVLLGLGWFAWRRRGETHLAPGIVFACCSLLIISFLLWRFFYYGELMPNSVFAKRASLGSSILFSGDYLRRFFIFYSPLVVLSMVSFVTVRSFELIVFRLPVLITFFAVAILGGFADGYPFTRYLFPLVPLFVLWAGQGVREIYRLAMTLHGPRIALLFQAASIIVLLVLQAFLGYTEYATAGLPLDWQGLKAAPLARLRNFAMPDSAPHRGGEPFSRGLGHHQLADWLRTHASDSQLLATYEIGIVPYYSNLRVLDLFGLADREIAHRPGAPGLKAEPEYVFGRSPDYFAVRVPTDCLCFYSPIFRRPEFEERYELAAAFPYWTTEWLLFRRTASSVSTVYRLGWEPASQGPITDAAPGSRSLPVKLEGKTLFDPYLQLLEPLEKEKLSLQILASSESGTAREAMRRWMATWQRSFVFPSDDQRRDSRLVFDFTVPPAASLRFSLAAAKEGPLSPDPVELEVLLASRGAVAEKLFHKGLNESARPKPGWEEIELDLNQFSGRQVRLSFVRTGARQPVAVAIGEPRIVAKLQAPVERQSARFFGPR